MAGIELGHYIQSPPIRDARLRVGACVQEGRGKNRYGVELRSRADRGLAFARSRLLTAAFAALAQFDRPYFRSWGVS
jgi:hypothetical protein